MRKFLGNMWVSLNCWSIKGKCSFVYVWVGETCLEMYVCTQGSIHDSLAITNSIRTLFIQRLYSSAFILVYSPIRHIPRRQRSFPAFCLVYTFTLSLSLSERFLASTKLVSFSLWQEFLVCTIWTEQILYQLRFFLYLVLGWRTHKRRKKCCSGIKIIFMVTKAFPIPTIP